MGHAQSGWYPDPRQQGLLRYWDGNAWTAYVDRDGQRYMDAASVDDLPVPLDTTTDGSTSGALAPSVPASEARTPTKNADSADASRTHGDQVLQALGTVTLSNWANRRMAEGFLVPQLIDEVRARPDDPLRRFWLGFRLLEMEEVRQRIRRVTAPVTVTGMVLRPVTRAVTRSLASEATPASVKGLRAALDGVSAKLRKDPQDPMMLNLAARVYLAAARREGDGLARRQVGPLFHVHKAMGLLEKSIRLDPENGQAYYLMAEAMVDSGRNDEVLPTAQLAVRFDCTLGKALLWDKSAGARAVYRFPKVGRFNGYSPAKYWTDKARYYQYADPTELTSFFGPSPV